MGLTSRIGAVLVGAVGLVVLIGWYTGTAALTTVLPHLAPMKPITAVALIVLSLSVGLAHRWAAVSLAAVTVALALATLVGYALGSTFGIAGWVPGIDLAGQEPRMAPLSAVGLILLGTAAIAVRLSRTTLTQVFAHASLLISLIALLGYAYGVSSLYTVAGFTSIALHTALSLAILSVAVLLQQPTVGLVGLLRERGSAGQLMRRAVPFLVLGPFLLGWLRILGQREGLYDTVFGVAILIMSMTVLGVALMWIAALKLRELDRQRNEAMQALAEVNHTLEETVDRRTRELGEVADKLHTFIKIAPVGIVQLDSEGGLLTANDQWLALSGLPLRECLGDGWVRAMHPDDVDRVSGEWGAAVAAGSIYETTLRFLNPQGLVHWVQVSTAPIHGLDAVTVTGHLATVTDITELRDAEEAAAAARARFEAAFASSPLGTAIVSLDGEVLEANKRLFDLAGRSTAVITGHIDEIFMPAGADGGDRISLTDGPSTRQRMDRRMRRVDAEETWVKVSIAEINEGESTGGLLYQLEDITARRLAEARVEHLAFHDPLTSLPNRLLLLDRLNQALIRAAHQGQGVAVLFIDLDRFKFVNDSLGHHAGDAVLTEVGIRLRMNARATDTVSRIGGDEFVVICPDVGSNRDVHKIAEALQKAIAEPIHVGDQVASVDASIGIAFGLGHDDAESLLRNADQAMYLAKGRGRARYEVFDDDLRARIERRLDTELALRDAVDLGEIETWFQPIVDLQQRTVVATEALARWRRPERGLVLPGEFIAIAEEVGLIKGIGTTVLGQACQAVASLDEGMAVSVNVSPRQFVQDDFGAVVKRALKESGLPPHQLWLELTESAVLDAIDSAARTFQELRSLGVRLAIDDFGTGYSSFTHLKAFTVDLLKIDLTFIRDLERSEHDRAIVEGILRLADSLNLDVVAEGIETTGQRDLLTGMGCRYGQGYLFSKPAPSVSPDVYFGD
ncbi:bifunctional diguanylate cyclase/phosphodiesterase [Cryobacterium sp. HLT2-28]|uniref:putative bifunctional diguanylate cyclase/phosphodiesterase n=1 Tax=Cryobacterium sp. HLT2-28 TaxID=1259146 RepID=UPI00106AE465|nr:GGDEF domain-containing phosphodiesterase [Cryobacterium sp. HLT2-28]TFB96976.1 phosphodiesterase [Cryobacterium sp. HLT2-28]